MLIVASVCLCVGAVVTVLVYAVVRANRELDVMAGDE